MKETLYQYRFEILLISQLSILFGSLIVPVNWFDSWVSPVLFIVNILSGVLLFLHEKRRVWLILTVALIAIVAQWMTPKDFNDMGTFNAVKLFSFFLFYALLAFEIIRQVWYAKIVGKNVIFGLVSGFITTGLIGFFICLSIEIYNPGSFDGIKTATMSETVDSQGLLYYSYITLMTIGYGDIVPTTLLARKAAVLIGLIGQFYLVILTAIIVGKFLNNSIKGSDKD